MNHPGETAYLAGIARPTVALVNNAQREHQEFMHSVEEVAREHGAVFAALPADGVAVINADDTYAGYWRGAGARRGGCCDFGIEQPAAVGGRYALRDFGSDIVLARARGRGDVQRCRQPACTTCATPWRRPPRPRRPASACDAIARGLAGFRAGAGAAAEKRGRQRRGRPRRHLQRQSGLGASPRSTCCAGCRAGESPGAGRHGRSRRARRGVPRAKSGAYARSARHRRGCSRSASLARMRRRRSARARACYAQIEALLAELEPQTRRGRDRARQGLALHAHGARRAGAHRPQEERCTDAARHSLSSLAKDVRAFNVFGYITLRAVLACLTALAISFIAGPLVIRKLTAYKIGQSVRDDGPQVASDQGRHARPWAAR